MSDPARLWWYVTTTRWTCAVETTDALVITTTPPLLRRFRGQHLRNLTGWARRFDGFGFVRLA